MQVSLQWAVNPTSQSLYETLPMTFNQTFHQYNLGPISFQPSDTFQFQFIISQSVDNKTYNSTSSVYSYIPDHYSMISDDGANDVRCSIQITPDVTYVFNTPFACTPSTIVSTSYSGSTSNPVVTNSNPTSSDSGPLSSCIGSVNADPSNALSAATHVQSLHC